MKLFKGKKIFITGHTGFKGSWLTKMLLAMGAEVKGYALAAEKESNFEILNLSKEIIHVEADIRDTDRLTKEITDFEPDFFFHLAAQPIVLESYKNPVYTFEVNYMGVVFALEALRKLEKPCVAVFITTDKVYADQNWNYPYRENDKLGGFDPYSASKASCELAINSYRNSFFNLEQYDSHQKKIVSARAGNVIGGGDFSPYRLLPDILQSIKDDQTLKLRNPDAVRPWQHVLDACYAYLVLASNLYNSSPNKLSNAYNFAPEANESLTVEDLVKHSINFWGKGSYTIDQSNNNQKETHFLRLDITLAKVELNWKPKWSTLQALEKTIEWQKAYLTNNKEVIKLSERHIEEILSS